MMTTWSWTTTKFSKQHDAGRIASDCPATKWLFRAAARNDQGKEVFPSKATHFCLAMAVIEKAKDAQVMRDTFRVLGFANAVSLGAWNDREGRTRQDVLALIDAKIAKETE